MPASIHIRQRAHADLLEIIDYLRTHSESAAVRFVLEAYSEFRFLAEHPGAGPIRRGVPKRLRGLRFWPMKRFSNYLVFYLPLEDGVDIIRVLHGARNVGRIIRES
jgi:toxin ParE1/3/4